MRKANHKDVLDELEFIRSPKNNYSNSQREQADNLLGALVNTKWNPPKMMELVVDILDKHVIEIPLCELQIKEKVFK